MGMSRHSLCYNSESEVAFDSQATLFLIGWPPPLVTRGASGLVSTVVRDPPKLVHFQPFPPSLLVSSISTLIKCPFVSSQYVLRVNNRVTVPTRLQHFLRDCHLHSALNVLMMGEQWGLCRSLVVVTLVVIIEHEEFSTINSFLNGYCYNICFIL